MAMEYQGFATLGVNLNRQKYGPLDVSSVFTSTADLTYYRTKGQTKLEGLSDYWNDIVPYPYEGQIVSLVENGEVSIFKLVANGDVFDVVAIGGGSDSEIQDLSDRIDEIIADLEHEAIDITSFTHNLGTVEFGATVTNVTLNWAINKTPTTLTLNGVALDDEVIQNTKIDLTVNINKDSVNKGWTLVATDDRTSDTYSTAISFSNGIYYGVVNKGATITDTLIKNLVEQQKITKKLQSSPSAKFTSTAGKDEVFLYALPASYKTPIFVDAETNLPAGMYRLSQSIQFKNQSDYTEPYNIWLSEQAGLGTMTIIVSEVV